MQQKQQKRHHFHLSSPDLARESFGPLNAPEVTSTDMIRAMMAYVWPKDDQAVRKRVLLSLGLLAGGKILNVSVPFLFKGAIDHLNVLSMATPQDAALSVTTALLLGCKLKF